MASTEPEIRIFTTELGFYISGYCNAEIQLARENCFHNSKLQFYTTQNSSDSKVTCYGLDDSSFNPSSGRDFSLHHQV